MSKKRSQCGIVSRAEDVPAGYAPLRDVICRRAQPYMYEAARKAIRCGELPSFKVMASAHHVTGALWVELGEVREFIADFLEGRRLRACEATVERADSAAAAAATVSTVPEPVRPASIQAIAIDASELASTIRQLEGRIAALSAAVADLTAAVQLDIESRVTQSVDGF